MLGNVGYATNNGMIHPLNSWCHGSSRDAGRQTCNVPYVDIALCKYCVMYVYIYIYVCIHLYILYVYLCDMYGYKYIYIYRRYRYTHYVYMIFAQLSIIERSLEVKLPTIWTDEKQRWEESEKRREEERRSKKRKSQKKEDPGAHKGRKVAKHCVFPMI